MCTNDPSSHKILSFSNDTTYFVIQAMRRSSSLDRLDHRMDKSPHNSHCAEEAGSSSDEEEQPSSATVSSPGALYRGGYYSVMTLTNFIDLF